MQNERTVTRWQWFEARMTHVLEGEGSGRNIAMLDGIRALACLAVVTFHISYNFHLELLPSLGVLLPSLLMAGDTGVTLFFVLSGFLLFLPYARSLLFGKPWPSLWRFYLRRALRILPGYYVALFLLIVFTQPQYLRLDHFNSLLLFLTLFMDSSTETYRQINGPFWTLAVEWQFYLFLPLFALAVRVVVQRGSLTRRVCWLALCLAGLMAWGVFSRWAGLYITSHPSQSSALPPAVLHASLFFLFGTSGNGLHGKFLEDFAVGMAVCACYVLVHGLPPHARFVRLLRRLSPWLWRCGLLWLVLLAVWKFYLATPLTGALIQWLSAVYTTWSELCFALGYACLVLAVLFGSWELQRVFSWSPARWIGHISYSFYIWHLPLLLLFLTIVLPHLPGMRLVFAYGLGWLWILCAAIPFSLLFFLVCEQPWMRLSDRWLKQKRATT